MPPPSDERRPPLPLPSWRALSGALLFGTLLSLVLVEALARIVIEVPWGRSVDEMAKLVPLAWTRGAFVPDPELGYRMAPSFEGRMVRLEQYDEVFRTNSLGLRDAEVGPRDGLTRRILVIGDSFVFGLGVGQDEPFPRLLERRLRAGGERVEVVNAGVVGYGLEQYDTWLGRLLPRLEPDVVLVSVYAGNDLGSYERISHHQVRDGYLIERAGPVVSWLIRNTALGFGIASKRRQIQRRLGLKPEPTPAADVASAATHLESLAARATAAGVPIGFVVLPDRHQLVSSTRKRTPASQPPTSALKLDLDRRLELARPHLEATGGPVLDVTPDLARLDIREIYFPRDPHLTVAGHEAVARRLEPWLRSQFPAN